MDNPGVMVSDRSEASGGSNSSAGSVNPTASINSSVHTTSNTSINTNVKPGSHRLRNMPVSMLVPAATSTSSPAAASGAGASGSGLGAPSTSSAVSVNIPSYHAPELDRLSRPVAFDKMEALVRVMQDAENKVPVRSQKLFLTSIPSAFMGYDLVEWTMEHMGIEESEALSIANQLCMHGYFFPVNDTKTLLVKDDSSLYRFQTPYYWPWQHRAPDNVEYAIYLAKRSLRNKQRHGLEEYESEALASLHKNLKAKWDFIQLQAEEQVRIAKERKKGDKIVHDSQERAYWRVHRPPPGQFTPMEPCPIPSRDRQGKPRRRTVDDWQREVDYLRLSMGRTRMKMSQACECLAQYSVTFADYDYYLQPVVPSNPWVTEDLTYWLLNGPLVDAPVERRVRRWAISIDELVSDPTGLQEFTAYLKKEYSHENIRFWTAVNDLRRSPHSQIGSRVKEIYEEFLEPGAPCEINIDGQTMEKVQQGLRATPTTRFTFDSAAEHIYMLLLKKDCYPRFIRSDHYKSLLASGPQPLHKKRFFGFGAPKKKSSTTTTPASASASLLSGAGCTGVAGNTSIVGGTSVSGSLARRRGSDRSLTGSSHELAASASKDATGGGAGNQGVPQSHSNSNMSDIPYRTDPKHCESSNICPWDDPPDIECTNNPELHISKPLLTPSEPRKSCLKASPVAQSSSEVIKNPDPHGESDIENMTDRLRRSCGLRQSTVDCEMIGPKRLDPTAITSTEHHRRSSMSVMASRPVNTNWSPTSTDTPYNQPTKETQFTEHSSTTTSRTQLPPQAISMDAAIEHEVRPSSAEMRLDLPHINRSSSVDPANLFSCAISENESVTTVSTGNESVHATPIVSQQAIEADSRITASTPICSTQPSNSVNFANTPTITVFCPLGATTAGNNQQNIPDTDAITIAGPPQDETMVASALAVRFTIDTINVDDISPTTDEYQECCAHDEFPPSAGATRSSPVAPARITQNEDISTCESIDMVVGGIKIAPTVGDYELVASSTASSNPVVENLVEDNDIEEPLAPGCVAPAPTPAPSIAPLAEIEGNDDGDDDELGSIALAPCDTPFSSVRNAAGDKMEGCVPIGADVILLVARPGASVSRQQSEDVDTTGIDPAENTANTTTTAAIGPSSAGTQNAVCPWEDENVTVSTDESTFVKTYATLGYL